jgi:foldase protein PrsA
MNSAMMVVLLLSAQPVPAPPAAPVPSGPPPVKSVDGAAGIAAIWQDSTITWDRLRPVLAELAGSAALQEVLLDEQLAERARTRGIAPDAAALKREEELLLGYLDKDRTRADRLLEELRARQGLGPVRWNGLLWRNAVLRALVAPDVEVQETQIMAAHDAAHGPKRKPRVIAVPDLRGAQNVTDRLAKGDRFEDIAAEISTDISGARGGLISPMSKFDPGVPAAVREALWSVPTVGAVSAPVLVGTGYVIVRYEGDVAGDGVPLSAVHEEAARAVRIAQERARMDQLAQELVRTAKPTIFDDALADGWNRVRMEATRSGPPPQE